jgi:hypothetical protein
MQLALSAPVAAGDAIRRARTLAFKAISRGRHDFSPSLELAIVKA